MSNIINKSNHPIEVKRIDVRIWKLRDEIEAAIEHRLKDQDSTNSEPVAIDDIRDYYLKFLNSTSEANAENDDQNSEPGEDSNLDSSGNPLDDDAMAMMEALGSETEESQPSEEEEEKDPEESQEDEPQEEEEEKPTTEDSQEDDPEAAALAAQMLGDQGLGDDSPDSEDDEASELAAQMLAEQGGQADSKETTSEKTKPFERVFPKEEKMSHGYCLLSDIQMDQIMVFSKDTFIVGQNVIIEFLIPNSFSQITQVLGTSNISRKSSIISATKPDFRLQCLFMFKFPGERSTLRDFLKSVEPEIPEPPKKLKRPDDDDEDDDFDDLGF